MWSFLAAARGFAVLDSGDLQAIGHLTYGMLFSDSQLPFELSLPLPPSQKSSPSPASKRSLPPPP